MLSPIFSAVITSSLLIMFVSFLSARIDQTIKWNWLTVCTPIYLLQTCYMIDAVLILTRQRFAFKLKNLNLASFVCGMILLFAFEILLCLKLEYFPTLQFTFVFIPVWLLFILLIVYLLIKLAS